MTKGLPKDPYQLVINALNLNGIDYVVVGMSGINYYAKNPSEMFGTMDYDIFLKPTIINVKKAVELITKLGFSCGTSAGKSLPKDLREVVKKRSTIVTTTPEGIMVELLLNISHEGGLDHKKMQVASIAALTILLWLTSGIHKIPSAVVALLAAGLFSFTGLLDKNDFKKINWDVLILMWGGLSLGKGMESSGLASWVVNAPIFSMQGFYLLVVFCVLAVLFSNFVSNTATANLIIPIALSRKGPSP